MQCAFCDSVEIQDRTISENQLAKAFLTNIPIVPGHVLIIPKRHVQCLEDATEQEKVAIENLRVRIKAALQLSFGAQGFNYAWNDGTTAGQSVPHFHLHVVPRKEGDVGIYQYEPRQFLYRPGARLVASPAQELTEIATLLRAAL